MTVANKDDDTESTVSHSPRKREWIEKWIQKLRQSIQTDENKKMIQVFILDPVMNYVLERLFPYILIFCVLFVLLVGMIALTLALIFLRVPTPAVTPYSVPAPIG
jgi:uncharacterized membrane protein